MIIDQLKGQLLTSVRSLTKSLVEKRGNEQPPFRPIEYARILGIKKIIENDLGKDADAILFKKPEGFVIEVNRYTSAYRQNFSIAHELSHLIMEKTLKEANIEAFRTAGRHPIEEQLCDFVASEMLMPHEVFERYFDTFGNSICSVDKLSNVFQTSLSATIRRMTEISKETCIALQWKLWKKKSGSKCLHLAWKTHPTIAEKEFYYKPLDSDIRTDSSIFRAYYSDEIIKTHKQFILNKGIIKRCYIESRGFGYGENRHVLSLVYPER